MGPQQEGSLQVKECVQSRSSPTCPLLTGLLHPRVIPDDDEDASGVVVVGGGDDGDDDGDDGDDDDDVMMM